jgi:hypothetical protein
MIINFAVHIVKIVMGMLTETYNKHGGEKDY